MIIVIVSEVIKASVRALQRFLGNYEEEDGIRRRLGRMCL